jgi:hypothetical protein
MVFSNNVCGRLWSSDESFKIFVLPNEHWNLRTGYGGLGWLGWDMANMNGRRLVPMTVLFGTLLSVSGIK